ncbi:RxLR effector protein, partial [Phytophthora megakarya]
MRQSVLLFFLVVIIAGSDSIFAIATIQGGTARHLKGVQSLDTFGLQTEGNEEINTEDEERGWKDTVNKLNPNIVNKIDDAKVPVTSQSKWQSIVAYIQSGKFKNVDITNIKWK